jgi:hypothetical protein
MWTPSNEPNTNHPRSVASVCALTLGGRRSTRCNLVLADFVPNVRTTRSWRSTPWHKPDGCRQIHIADTVADTNHWPEYYPVLSIALLSITYTGRLRGELNVIQDSSAVRGLQHACVTRFQPCFPPSWRHQRRGIDIWTSARLDRFCCLDDWQPLQLQAFARDRELWPDLVLGVLPERRRPPTLCTGL